MRTLSWVSATLVISLCLLCPGNTFAGITMTTDAKRYRVELELDPPHPIVGNNAAVLTVSDARSNQKLDGASIEAIPWMTMHSHGSSKKPSIKKLGAGRYQVENLYFTMKGDWDLIISIKENGVRDSAIFPILNVKKK